MEEQGDAMSSSTTCHQRREEVRKRHDQSSRHINFLSYDKLANKSELLMLYES